MKKKRENNTDLVFKVIGGNALDGDLMVWHFADEELADNFAKQLAFDTQQRVDVCRLVSEWQPKKSLVIRKDYK